MQVSIYHGIVVLLRVNNQYWNSLLPKGAVHNVRWQGSWEGGLAKCQRYYINFCIEGTCQQRRLNALFKSSQNYV